MARAALAPPRGSLTPAPLPPGRAVTPAPRLPPLPLSLRSRYSAASSSRWMLIIWTCSMAPGPAAGGHRSPGPPLHPQAPGSPAGNGGGCGGWSEGWPSLPSPWASSHRQPSRPGGWAGGGGGGSPGRARGGKGKHARKCRRTDRHRDPPPGGGSQARAIPDPDPSRPSAAPTRNPRSRFTPTSLRALTGSNPLGPGPGPGPAPQAAPPRAPAASQHFVYLCPLLMGGAGAAAGLPGKCSSPAAAEHPATAAVGEQAGQGNPRMGAQSTPPGQVSVPSCLR